MAKKVYAISKNRRVAVIGFALVLITCAILSYNDYQAISKRSDITKSNYKFTTDLLRDKIGHEIISREEKLYGYLNQLQTRPESIDYLKSWLIKIDEDNHIMRNPFLLNQTGGIITDRVSSGWEKDKIELTIVNEIASIDFKKAENAEFSERDFDKAILLYREALNNATAGDSAVLTSAIARCFLKKKDFLRAAEEYNRLMKYGDEKLRIGEIPVKIAALTQLADLYGKMNEYPKRFNALIELYKYLIKNPWDSNEDGYNYYLKSTSAEIRKAGLQSVVSDSTKQSLVYLEKSEAKIYEEEDYAKTIRDTVFPTLDLSFHSPPTKSNEMHYFEYKDRDNISRLGYFVTANSFLKPKLLILGFQVNSSYLTKELLPEILNGINLDNDMYAGLLDQKDSILYCSGKLSSQKYLIAENLPDEFFPCKVALFDREGKSIEQQINKEKQQAFLLFGMTVFVLIMGMVIIVRAAKQDYQVSKLKSDFVAHVSHELKTPLSVIRMFGETLESGIVTEKSRQQEFYGIIRRESERLTDLINNVLDFSKIESGKKEFHFKETDLLEVVNNIVETYRPQIDNSGFQFKVVFPGGKVIMTIDKDAIAQALINLLNNALKYSDDEKYILVEVSEAGDFVTISVTDHGIGIDEKEFRNIFENFYRITNSKAAQIKGTGLGLTIAKYIVEAHKGIITVESEVGKGSKFTISLPKYIHLT
jgi:signal transduction histidine kinase